MGKLDPYLLILVGSIPALITLLITQIVTFARDNRNLLLEKYEEALISANYKYRLFHLNSVRIEKLLKSGSKIESFTLDKIQKFLREYTERDREHIQPWIVQYYDNSLTKAISEFEQKETDLHWSIVKIVSNIAKKSLETYSVEESDFGFNTNKENFYQSYESLEQVLKYKLENTGKNPFLKFIVGYPNINKK